MFVNFQFFDTLKRVFLISLHLKITGPKIWNNSKEIRNLPTLSSFKKSIRKIDLDILASDDYCDM